MAVVQNFNNECYFDSVLTEWEFTFLKAIKRKAEGRISETQNYSHSTQAK